MSQSEFNVGDVVQLKSGGPEMTIVEVLKHPQDGKIVYDCKWFNDNSLPQSAVFPENTLIGVD